MRNSSGVVKNNSVEIDSYEFIPNRMGMNIYQDNDAEISGNTINNSKTYGIRITNGDNIKLTDNNIDNSKTTYDMFKRVKQFYKRLKIELHRNGQM